MEALNNRVALGLSVFAASGAVAAEQAPDVFAAQQPAAVEQQVQVQQPTFEEFLAKQKPTHEAAEAPVAHAADFSWDVVGGAPFKDGGINTKKEAAQMLHSGKGHKAMRKEGLNSAEIKALDKAAGKNGEGVKDCTILPNVKYPVMISKNYDKKTGVKLNGDKYPQGIPAFCVTAVRKYKKDGKEYKETITQAQAKTCDNFVLMSKKKESHKKEVAKKPKTAPVTVSKIAIDAFGSRMPQTPTGTFQFIIKNCYQNGKLQKPRTAIYSRENQVLANCDVSYVSKKTHKTVKRTVNVSEPTKVENILGKDMTLAVTLGPDKWMPLTPTEQVQKMTSKGAKFVFKNGELPPNCTDAAYMNSVLCVTPPTPPNPPVTPPESCPPGTNFDDKNHNGKIDEGECVVPKDGTQGAGAGTPGTTNTGSTVGGPGAGGQPGNTEASVPCYDAADSQNGDLNPATEGDTMYVMSKNNVDQQGYCIGKAEAAVNG